MGHDGRPSSVASNGAVLEQSQILTTHNLAVLVDALELADELREVAPEPRRPGPSTGSSAVAQAAPYPTGDSALILTKNTAYAWRQAIFFLSFCDEVAQREAMARLRDRAAVLGPRFAPAVDGLAGCHRGQPLRRLRPDFFRRTTVARLVRRPAWAQRD